MPTHLRIQWAVGCFPGVKRPKREVDHSYPYSPTVKNECSSTSTPPICLHGLDRENSSTCSRTFREVNCFSSSQANRCFLKNSMVHYRFYVFAVVVVVVVVCVWDFWTEAKVTLHRPTAFHLSTKKPYLGTQVLFPEVLVFMTHSAWLLNGNR